MSSDQKIYVLCIGAALVSWLFLNRHSVRGDHFVVFYACIIAVLSAQKFWSPIPFSVLKVIALYFPTLSLITVAYRLSPFHPLANYPGPILWRISSVVLAFYSFTGKRHLYIDEFHKKYGPFVRIGPNALTINSINASPILYGAKYHMEKSESYNKPGHIGGVSLFFKHTREESTKRKRIWYNAFSGSAIEHYFPPLERRTWQLTNCIESRTQKSTGIVDLSECLAHWSYDFMGEMVFGGSNDLELMRSGDPQGFIPGGKMATAIVDSFGQAPWIMDILWHLPSSKDIHRLQELSANMMRNRVKRNGDVSIKDVASYLIEGDRSTGERISMSDLEVESLIAIQGGSDNTAMTMALIFFFLLTHPHCYAKLQAELDKVFPDPTAPLSNEKIGKVPYVEACVTEALRLASPFFIPRIVPQGGCEVDGNFIPEGSVVALSAYSLQIDPKHFHPDPMAYRPERWLPNWEGPEKITNKAAFVSFSSGPYVCVAKNFALQEMKLVVSRLVLTFDMSLPDIFDSEAFFNGFGNMRTSVFDRPLYVKAVRRSEKTKLEALAHSPL